MNSFDTGWRFGERERNLCQGWLNLDRVLLCFLPYYTLTSLLFSYDYLITLFQGHMAIHAATIMTHLLLYLWLINYY